MLGHAHMLQQLRIVSSSYFLPFLLIVRIVDSRVWSNRWKILTVAVSHKVWHVKHGNKAYLLRAAGTGEAVCGTALATQQCENARGGGRSMQACLRYMTVTDMYCGMHRADCANWLLTLYGKAFVWGNHRSSKYG